MKGRFVPESILGTNFVGRSRYRLEQVLASDGLAHVYLASTDTGDRVAVKLLRPEHETRGDVVARFEREALAGSRIQHENVMRVFEPVQRSGPYAFFSAEHLVGVDLADALQSQRRLGVARALKIVLGAATGLCAAHAAGVVHRDVKPENVFLVHMPDGREVVKIVDFGSAALESDPSPSRALRITMTTGFVGTPGYMAPEQAEGVRGHPTADVYSLGVVLFELLVGKAPFTGASWSELVTKHAREPVVVPASVPPALRAILEGALEKDPARRLATMADLAAAIRGIPELQG